MLKKLIILGIFGVVGYQVLKFYALHTLDTEVLVSCVGPHEMSELKARKAPPADIEEFMRVKFGCIASKQNALQAFFFKIPETWLNPPPGSVTYEDLPD